VAGIVKKEMTGWVEEKPGVYLGQTKERSLEFFKEISVRVMRLKNMVMGPTGPGTKNDCAGEGQQ
jgi:hypothetical protein